MTCRRRSTPPAGLDRCGWPTPSGLRPDERRGGRPARCGAARGHSMTTMVVVQARTGSSRLPGKVLAPVAGRPMLRLLLDRLAPVAADRVVVATSDRTADDAIEEIASDARVATVRGPEDDVLPRFLLVLDTYPSDMVVRVTADCPLTDPAIVDLAVDRLRATGADY